MLTFPAAPGIVVLSRAGSKATPLYWPVIGWIEDPETACMLPLTPHGPVRDGVVRFGDQWVSYVKGRAVGCGAS